MPRDTTIAVNSRPAASLILAGMSRRLGFWNLKEQQVTDATERTIWE
jgi:hypothetical protein